MNAIVTIICTMLLTPAGGTPAAGSASSADRAPVVRLIDDAERRALPGATRPLHHATLGTPFDTLISEIRVKEGQFVRKGEVIAVLDDRVARAAVRVSELDASNTAAVERSRATLARAEAVLARTVEARESSVANEDELDEAMSEHAVARADLLAAEQTLERARLELEHARAKLEEHLVRAPFDATVLRVHTEPGVVLSPGDPIAELATLDRICVDLHLPSASVLPIDEGQTYALGLGHPLDAVLPARVRYIERRIDPTSRTQRVVFEFTDPEAELSIGLLVEPADRLPTARDVARSRSPLYESVASAPVDGGE